MRFEWLLLGEGPRYRGAETSGANGDDRSTSSFPGLPEEDLRRLSALAQRGGTLGAWRVWQLLAEEPEGLKVEELAARLGLSVGDVEGDLALLRAYRAIEEDWGRLRTRGGILESKDPANVAQHGLEALRFLGSEVLPALERGGQMMLLEVPVGPGEGGDLLRRLRDQALRSAQEGEGAGEPTEVVRLLLAGNVAPLDLDG